MNKKTLLKSIIGTVGIYMLLIAFFIIFRNILDVLVYLPIYVAVFAACSIAAGLLFKGQIYVWVWTAVTVILFVVVWWPISWDFIFYEAGVTLAPLLIPFLIVKSIFVSIKLQEQEKS